LTEFAHDILPNAPGRLQRDSKNYSLKAAMQETNIYVRFREVEKQTCLIYFSDSHGGSTPAVHASCAGLAWTRWTLPAGTQASLPGDGEAPIQEFADHAVELGLFALGQRTFEQFVTLA
jgi:hypothetical protein